jgi:HEAT repeat protein
MTNGKTEIFTERIEKREHKFVFKLTDEPKMVIFDPNHWLPLKKVDFIKPHKLWANQLRLAENVMARVEAVHAISAWGSMEALDLLKAAFKREKFWGIQQEIARAVANLRSEGAMETLIGFLGVKNPKSRRAVVEALEGFKSRRVAVALSKLIGKDPSYLVQSQAAAVVGRCRTPQSSSILKRAMKEDSWNEVIRQGAVRGFAALCNGELLPQMKKFAACGNPYPIRIAALSELYQHGKGNTLVRDFFISLYQDPDKRIRNESIYALGQLGDPVAVKHLEKIKEESPHESTQRLADEAIRKIRLDIVEK